MKACNKCGEEKPLDGFYKTGNSDGRDSTCKDCRKAWHDENGEAANADHKPLPQFHMKEKRQHNIMGG